jgi:hypothetical protein
MKLFCSASKDTYITNKVISNISKKKANLGRAGVLDLFKIYDENNTLVDGGIELSRILIQFDYENLIKLLNSKIDINHDSFCAKLKLFDVDSGIPKPSKFNLIVYPLAKSFDEGIGRDVSTYGDFDTANYINASYADGSFVAWDSEGANSIGLANENNIDVINGIEINSEVKIFNAKQFFQEGNENLEIDITEILVYLLKNKLPNYGFRISFISSQETDDKSRILKRFASRHSVNPQIRPRIEISFDDSESDDRNNIQLDINNKLKLENYIAGSKKNFFLNATEEITGEDCIGVELEYKDLKLDFVGSQIKAGSFDNLIPGSYEVNVFLDSSLIVDQENNISLYDELLKNKTIVFKEKWYSILNPSKVFNKGELVVKFKNAKNQNFGLNDLQINFKNLKQNYFSNSLERIKIFIDDLNLSNSSKRIKTLNKQSVVIDNLYYQIRDTNTGEIIIKFDFEKNSTKISYDAESLYFDFDFSVLNPGRTYSFDFCIKDLELKNIYRSYEIFGVI